jgi:hypothetical protein
MLAICSDLDETPDRTVYWESARYLNTTEDTAMGPGVGLEVGNTIYFDMPRSQFAYWNTDDCGRAQVRALIRSGHVDCLHSFGDLSTTRASAARALDDLVRHDCQLRVWIDHARAATNFGADIMGGLGDVPGAEPYHADLSHDYGLRYVWRGRVSSVIGQDAHHSLGGIFDGRHPTASAITVAKELAKRVAGGAWSEKYAMNAANRLLRPTILRSGHSVLEFLRSNPSWAGVSRFESSDGLAEVLTERFLQRLEGRGSACILYTHLGKVTSSSEPFGESTRAALRRLGRAQREGRVLVTTTRRLLDYFFNRSKAVVATIQEGQHVTLDVAGVGVDGELLGPRDLAGLTAYVPDPENTSMRINGMTVTELACNPKDATGQASVSVPWPRLEFPRL